MHPNDEELLSIREGVFEPRWQGHLDQCAECAARLGEIERVRSALRALPALEPAISWSDVQERTHRGLDTPSAPKRGRTQVLVGIGLAASVATIALLVSMGRNERSEPETIAAAHGESATMTVDLATLIDRSRRLDALLQTMPARPRVERVSTAATLDTMEGRIQWLDYQLSYAGDELDATQSQRLWQERVELMDSLVKVRYAQARTTTF